MGIDDIMSYYNYPLSKKEKGSDVKTMQKIYDDAKEAWQDLDPNELEQLDIFDQSLEKLRTGWEPYNYSTFDDLPDARRQYKKHDRKDVSDIRDTSREMLNAMLEATDPTGIRRATATELEDFTGEGWPGYWSDMRTAGRKYERQTPTGGDKDLPKPRAKETDEEAWEREFDAEKYDPQLDMFDIALDDMTQAEQKLISDYNKMRAKRKRLGKAVERENWPQEWGPSPYTIRGVQE